jgi:glycylpeptide N-tetradecanoyltransferase
MTEPQPVGAAEDAVPSGESGSEHEPQGTQESQTASNPPKMQKKKQKKSKPTSSILGDKSSHAEPSDPRSKMSSQATNTLLEMNPSLKGELAHLSPSQAQEMLKKMDASQLLTGLSLNPKNQKDMASHKFWQTQPVPRLDEKMDAQKQEDGPIQEVIPEKVPKTPAPLPEGYEWCELDLMQEAEIKEVYQLLTFHYVEDDNAMFRFNYSHSFLDWALKAPEWKKSWHIGVRAKGPSRLLVASIFGIPTKLRVRKNTLDVVEINFLCIHKKLRSKRLAPVLIKEITRRCHLVGIYQAVYTVGVILPTPVSSCRYFHRPLDWLKLYEVGFSPLPPHSTKTKMIAKNRVNSKTSTNGWRAMRESDVDSVHNLVSRYLRRFDLAQELSKEEVLHWFVDKHMSDDERTVWAFVVEGDEGKVTDFVSFYCLESSVIGDMSKKHEKVRAAYLFYYATEIAFVEREKGLKGRLNELINDALVEAKKALLS